VDVHDDVFIARRRQIEPLKRELEWLLENYRCRVNQALPITGSRLSKAV
jgi:hypothetical protein